MNNAHKATNKAYRDNYDEIFRKKKDDEKEDKPIRLVPRVAHR
ncbi:MAG: hypothetical protein R3267_04185 [Paenisporosarcina sp.]|nr:hypothetical protein [Paenisporosarcina sp.]